MLKSFLLVRSNKKVDKIKMKQRGYTFPRRCPRIYVEAGAEKKKKKKYKRNVILRFLVRKGERKKDIRIYTIFIEKKRYIHIYIKLKEIERWKSRERPEGERKPSVSIVLPLRTGAWSFKRVGFVPRKKREKREGGGRWKGRCRNNGGIPWIYNTAVNGLGNVDARLRSRHGYT